MGTDAVINADPPGERSVKSDVETMMPVEIVAVCNKGNREYDLLCHGDKGLCVPWPVACQHGTWSQRSSMICRCHDHAIVCLRGVVCSPTAGYHASRHGCEPMLEVQSSTVFTPGGGSMKPCGIDVRTYTHGIALKSGPAVVHSPRPCFILAMRFSASGTVR